MNLTPAQWAEFGQSFPSAHQWIAAREQENELRSLVSERRIEREQGRSARYTRLGLYKRARLAALLRLYRWRFAAGWITSEEFDILCAM